MRGKDQEEQWKVLRARWSGGLTDPCKALAFVHVKQLLSPSMDSFRSHVVFRLSQAGKITNLIKKKQVGSKQLREDPGHHGERQGPARPQVRLPPLACLEQHCLMT